MTGYEWPIRVYSIAQAKGQRSKLVDEPTAGEPVTVFTRHGKPVTELRPTTTADAGRPSAELIDGLAERAKMLPAPSESGADIIRRMSDEYP